MLKLILFILGFSQTVTLFSQTIHIDSIRIRDPFVLPVLDEKTYYMYSQYSRLENGKKIRGVQVYVSNDLTMWSAPKPVLTLPDTMWAKGSVWAPEVHKFKGKYYLFATLTGKVIDSVNGGRMPLCERATQIFYSDSPKGPFRLFENKAHTPANWMSLDGTLFVEDGIPYMVFCREWIEIVDGTMELVRLSDDLSRTVGASKTLFKATDAKWVRSLKDAGGEYHGYITDGPFFYRTNKGKLLMIWSSFGVEKYAVGIVESQSGKIEGPWVQHDEPFFKANGGHGMIFKAFDGRLMLVIHQPNTNPIERAKFFELEDTGDALKLKNE